MVELFEYSLHLDLFTTNLQAGCIFSLSSVYWTVLLEGVQWQLKGLEQAEEENP